MNKKILAILMALLMVAMSTVAMAETRNLPKITKAYVDANDAAVTVGYPDEVISFTAELFDVRQSEYTLQTAPDNLKNAQLTTIDTGDKLSRDDMVFTYTAPDKVGVYTYKVTETAGNTAGVTYDATTDFYVAVLAYYAEDGSIATSVTMADGFDDANKYGEDTEVTFTNEYVDYQLTIDKTVTGNLGDVNKAFAVKVTLNNPDGKEVRSTIGVSITDGPTAAAITAAGGSANPEAIAVGTETIFYVKDNTNITLTNIPAGVKYTVAEVDDPIYTEIPSGDLEGTFDADKAVAFENNYSSEIPTGVEGDNMMPYFMLLAFVMILASAVVLKKRTVNE